MCVSDKKNWSYSTEAKNVVTCECSDGGLVFRHMKKVAGPISLPDLERSDLHVQIAAELGVELKETLKAEFKAIQRPTTFAEIAEVLPEDLPNGTVLKGATYQ